MKKKTFRKLVVYLLVLGPLAFFIWGWFDMNYLTSIDSAEVDHYYDLLEKHEKPANTLTLSAGISESGDLETALQRLQREMQLEKFAISLTYGDQEFPPAFVQNINNRSMIITLSRRVKQLREQISCLVHELSHVAVWSLEPAQAINCGSSQSASNSIFKGCDLEKVVDTSGIYRGQGILSMNGLTDDTFYIPGGEFSKVQQVFGYIKPEQYGYLLARYCAERGILPGNVEPFLEPGVRKYFTMGRHYLKRSKREIKIKGRAEGIYFCPKCGQRISVDLSKEFSEIACSKCGAGFKKTNWDKASQFLERQWERFSKKLISKFPKAHARFSSKE